MDLETIQPERGREGGREERRGKERRGREGGEGGEGRVSGRGEGRGECTYCKSHFLNSQGFIQRGGRTGIPPPA